MHAPCFHLLAHAHWTLTQHVEDHTGENHWRRPNPRGACLNHQSHDMIAQQRLHLRVCRVLRFVCETKACTCTCVFVCVLMMLWCEHAVACSIAPVRFSAVRHELHHMTLLSSRLTSTSSHARINNRAVCNRKILLWRSRRYFTNS